MKKNRNANFLHTGHSGELYVYEQLGKTSAYEDVHAILKDISAFNSYNQRHFRIRKTKKYTLQH